ncbi:MAG: hypothetical protein KAS72_01000 [Phycisphaerales bacterium]|nr:hypothetical protein [Phycisphaerales bacterium]
MTKKQITLAVMLAITLVCTGCTVSTVRVRQDDGTYRTTRELTWLNWCSAHRSFTCTEDDMVATTVLDVKYSWPKGEGSFTGCETIEFRGNGVRCTLRGRELTVNGIVYEGFEPGDHVRITSDGRVFVNDAEQLAKERD